MDPWHRSPDDAKRAPESGAWDPDLDGITAYVSARSPNETEGRDRAAAAPVDGISRLPCRGSQRMASLNALTVVVCGLAFWMGYSINQAGTCAVAAAHEILEHRRPRLFVGLLAASATAALTTVPTLWVGIGMHSLAPALSVSASLAIGAAAFGAGALINDACLLGSLGRLGDGETRLLLVPFGLAAGYFLSERAGWLPELQLGESILGVPSFEALAALIGIAAVLIASLIFVSRRTITSAARHRWPLSASMVVMGVTGGYLYGLFPSWTYADLVHRVLPLGRTLSENALLAVMATVLGAIASGRRRRSWQFRRPTASGLARSTIGGILMGIGATAIPGGNDGLILAAIPALSPGGAVAYLAMMISIMAGLSIQIRALKFFS